MAKVRGMAAEFRASFDELARQSELDELRKEVQALRTTRPLDYVAGQIGGDNVLSDIHGEMTGAHADMTALTNPLSELPPQPPAPESASPAPPPEPEPAPPEPAPKASAS
jgi:sec-independent protein translocase protein TatB